MLKHFVVRHPQHGFLHGIASLPTSQFPNRAGRLQPSPPRMQNPMLPVKPLALGAVPPTVEPGRPPAPRARTARPARAAAPPSGPPEQRPFCLGEGFAKRVSLPHHSLPPKKVSYVIV